MGVGTGTTTATQNDTSVSDIKTYNSGTRYPNLMYPNNDLEVTFEYTLTSLEANGNTLTEMGLFNNATSGSMFCRSVHTASIKTNTFELSYELELNVDEP